MFFKLSCFDQLRTEVNKVLEVARTEKLIGSSLEAKVYLHTLDDSLAARLNEMGGAKNDADTLHRIFITSQVCSLSVHEFIPLFSWRLCPTLCCQRILLHWRLQVSFSLKHYTRRDFGVVPGLSQQPTEDFSKYVLQSTFLVLDG